ncbi:MAG: hypothetical protein DLD55_02160 [candidate division SR1 bacterium]|nr:MAG: hypothetical protein DLD55_02160 [candidate division SR1 bacterium]
MYTSGGKMYSNILRYKPSCGTSGNTQPTVPKKYKVDWYGSPFEWENNGIYAENGSLKYKVGTLYGFKKTKTSSTYDGGADPDKGEIIVSNSNAYHPGVKNTFYLPCSMDQRCSVTIQDSSEGLILDSELYIHSRRETR